MPIIRSKRVHDLIYGWVLAEADPDLRINVDYVKVANRIGMQPSHLYEYVNGIVAEGLMNRKKDRLLPRAGREISREGLISILLVAGPQRHCLGVYSILYNIGPMKTVRIARELGFTKGAEGYRNALQRLKEGGLVERDERGYWYLTNAYL